MKSRVIVNIMVFRMNFKTNTIAYQRKYHIVQLLDHIVEYNRFITTLSSPGAAVALAIAPLILKGSVVADMVQAIVK